ncbi:MAG TPA: hypothetical protein VN874_03360 [Myxococcales bacterium]|jgi:hypothetical protein|nr:hypothetical protein [Myxococcales bacterium]
MDERSAIDLNPEMSPGSQEVFTRVRLLVVAGLVVAMLAAALIVG